MLYAYISDLPPSVRNTLSVPRQEEWLAHYQTHMELSGNEAEAHSVAWNRVLAEAFPGEVVAVPVVQPAAERADGKVINITIQAGEGRTAENLESCVMELFNSDDMKAKYPDEAERKSHAFAICRSNLKMGEQYSYLADLTGAEFSATNENESWIQMLPLGKWNHPIHGTINITPERAQRFALNVNNNVRKQDLDIDYEHKQDAAKGRKAAGWIKRAEVRSDGLYGFIEWTPTARVEIKNGEWKYFSPEYFDEWVDPFGTKHTDVLLGGALTNRPFLKGILPVNLSEMLGGESTSTQQPEAEIRRFNIPREWSERDERKVVTQLEFIKRLTEALGLKDVDEEKVLTHVKSLHDFRTQRLSEEDKAKKFAELFPEEAKQLAEQQKQLREARVEKQLSEWTEKATHAIPPSVSDAMTEFALSLSDEQNAKFTTVMEEITKTGTVQLSERGSSTRSQDDEEDGSNDKFEAAVQKLLSESAEKGKPITAAEAIRQVSRETPELARQFRDSRREKYKSARGGD